MRRRRPSELKAVRQGPAARRGMIRSLFVYGSLLDAAVRERLLGRPVRCFPALLPGYARRRARYFYLSSEPGASTEGLVLADLTWSDLARLDAYEDVANLYTRQVVEVFDREDRGWRCWVYLPSAKLVERRSAARSKAR